MSILDKMAQAVRTANKTPEPINEGLNRNLGVVQETPPVGKVPDLTGERFPEVQEKPEPTYIPHKKEVSREELKGRLNQDPEDFKFNEKKLNQRQERADASSYGKKDDAIIGRQPGEPVREGVDLENLGDTSKSRFDKWDKTEIGKLGNEGSKWRYVKQAIRGNGKTNTLQDEFADILDQEDDENHTPTSLSNLISSRAEQLLTDLQKKTKTPKKLSEEEAVAYGNKLGRLQRVINASNAVDPIKSIDQYFRYNGGKHDEKDYLTFAAHHSGQMFGKQHRDNIYNITQATRGFGIEHNVDHILRYLESKGYTPKDTDKSHLMKVFSILEKHAGSMRPDFTPSGEAAVEGHKQRKRKGGSKLVQNVGMKAGITQKGGPGTRRLWGYNVYPEQEKSIGGVMMGERGRKLRQREQKLEQRGYKGEIKKDILSRRHGNKLLKRRKEQEQADLEAKQLVPGQSIDPVQVHQQKVELYTNNRNQTLKKINNLLRDDPKLRQYAGRLEEARNHPGFKANYLGRGSVHPDFADLNPLIYLSLDKEAGSNKDILGGLLKDLIQSEENLKGLGIRDIKGIIRPTPKRTLGKKLESQAQEEPKLASMSPQDYIKMRKSQLIAQKTKTVGDFIEEFTKSFESPMDRFRKRVFKSTIRGMIKEKLGLD